MNDRKRLSFGIKTSQLNLSYDDILTAWREADTIPVIERAWLIVRRGFGAYGITIVAAADAVRALGEACTLIRKMWTEDGPFGFAGRYYRLRGAVCEPKPVAAAAGQG